MTKSKTSDKHSLRAPNPALRGKRYKNRQKPQLRKMNAARWKDGKNWQQLVAANFSREKVEKLWPRETELVQKKRVMAAFGFTVWSQKKKGYVLKNLDKVKDLEYPEDMVIKRKYSLDTVLQALKFLWNDGVKK